MLLEDLGKKVDKDKVRQAIEYRAQQKVLEADAKKLKDQANEILKSVLPLLSDKKIECGGIGSVVQVTTTRNTVDIDAFKLNLAQKGVSVTLISEAEKASTKTTTSTSINYYPWKE